MDSPADKSLALPWPLLIGMGLLPTTKTVLAVHFEIAPAVTYPALILLMIALPLLIWRLQRRSRAELRTSAGLKRTNFLPGLATGALAVVVIVGGYYAVLAGRLDAQPLADKARALGLIDHYWLMAVGICLGNALFEEYYWRVFLFDGLRRRLRSGWAVCGIGGALFGLHHVFAMLDFFPPRWLGLFVLGTIVAGAAWSWMRWRGLSIWDCYVSHVMADAAIMWVGWDMISRTL